jgi:hypothetical protein
MPSWQLTEPNQGHLILLAPPPAVGSKPHRMTRVSGTRRPRRVDERVEKILLHIFNDLVGRIGRVAILEDHSGETLYLAIVLRAHRREDIAPKETDDVLEPGIFGDHPLTRIKNSVSAERVRFTCVRSAPTGQGALLSRGARRGLNAMASLTLALVRCRR